MMLLKNAKNIESLLNAVSHCKGEVILRKTDGSDTFNLKSTLSRYIALARLRADPGPD